MDDPTLDVILIMPPIDGKTLVAMDSTQSVGPLISVIVPVHNSPALLRLCIEQLLASTFSSFEVIVVDDASTDDTANIASSLGVRLLRLDQNAGPAVARNRGAEISRGDYIMFLDADVCVTPHTMGQVAGTFAQNPELAAIFGSYDTKPMEENVLSQFKNLFHHYVHQNSQVQATTFWSGCGAMRRSVFLEMGGFSVRYGRPAIEDIELGRRMHQAGHRIMLNKSIQVTHLKRWTLWSMMKTDVMDRGIPWTEMMLREGSIPNDLNTKYSQQMSVILTYGLLLILGFGIWYWQHLLLFPLFFLILITALDYWSTRRHFSTVVRVMMALIGVGSLAIFAYIYRFWPLLPLALIAGIIAINFRFYVFFLHERHLLLMFLVLPLHLIYFLYSGFAFAIGVALHLFRLPARRLHRRNSLSVAASNFTVG